MTLQPGSVRLFCDGPSARNCRVETLLPNGEWMLIRGVRRAEIVLDVQQRVEASVAVRLEQVEVVANAEQVVIA